MPKIPEVGPTLSRHTWLFHLTKTCPLLFIPPPIDKSFANLIVYILLHTILFDLPITECPVQMHLYLLDNIECETFILTGQK